jgi:hypothetical protein
MEIKQWGEGKKYTSSTGDQSELYNSCDTHCQYNSAEIKKMILE